MIRILVIVAAALALAVALAAAAFSMAIKLAGWLLLAVLVLGAVLWLSRSHRAGS